MEGGLLSLKWNNHRSTFLHVLSTVRHKESYCDVTLACDGKFYPVHKLVLSTCSEYFEQMFERTNCKHPIIVLKDIRKDDLEALLNYMYVGEVNVLQNNLSGLIKAAEGLRIKGLAVPDESPSETETSQDGKRSLAWGGEGPDAKRRRPEETSPPPSRAPSIDKISRDRSPAAYRDTYRTPVRTREPLSPSPITPSPEMPPPRPSSTVAPDPPPPEHPPPPTPQHDTLEPRALPSVPALASPVADVGSNEAVRPPEHELKLDDPLVKEEPQDNYNDTEDSKEGISEADGLNFSHHTGGLDTGSGSGRFSPGLRASMLPQTLEELVSQPGASGLQGKHLWEGDRALLGIPYENYTASQPRASQMVGLAALVRPEGDRAATSLRPFTHHSLTNFNPVCPYCNKSTFYSPRDLERHIRIHTGEKPYHCQHCSYRARLKAHMKSHLARIHGDAGNSKHSGQRSLTGTQEAGSASLQ